MDELDQEETDTVMSMINEPLLLRSRTNTTSQTALVGANLSPIESLNYEIIENDLIGQDWRSRTSHEIIQYVFLKWTLALVIGLSTGLVGFFNNLSVENIAGFKLVVTNNLMTENKYIQAFAAYAGCNLVLAVTASCLCAYLAPAAAGSGIPEVKAYLNGIDAHSILAPTTLLVKIFGSICSVAGGLLVGKEGPMVHTGACIASLMGNRKYFLTPRCLQYVMNDRDRRDLITCGAAAGVAAAFRAPVGGVLFALEEAASWWRSALLWRTFFTTAVVAIVLRTLTQLCRSGSCGLFGEGGLIMFSIDGSENASYGALDLIAVVVLGIFGGIFGSLYNYLVGKVLQTYGAINGKGRGFKISLVAGISLLTSCCAYGFPWFTMCSPCPDDGRTRRTGNLNGFRCPPGNCNRLASLLLNTNDGAIRSLFASGVHGEFDVVTLLVFFMVSYYLGVLTYGIAVPSGLFIPIILAGASFGRLVGTILSGMDSCFYALLGAASFLGGTMRMTVSLCVILLELTDYLLMLPLVMLVLLISKTLADTFNDGVYDQIVRMKGLPYMESHAEPYMRNLAARDVVSGSMITLSAVEKVSNVYQALRMTNHNGFPVIDGPRSADPPELCGLVLRSHLLVLLSLKRFTNKKVSGSAGLLRWEDFATAGSGREGELNLSEEEMGMYVDLHPITNTSPHTVVETMSLAKAAVLFRELGLRHLLVVPKNASGPPVVGILTRHDFMPEHVFGLHPQRRHPSLFA